MPVQNIECQIARAQLGRYLAGEGMAGEAVRQLEAHINRCAECKSILEEKRSALIATLEGSETPSPAPTSKSLKDPRSSSSRLLEAIMAKAAAEAAAPKAEAVPLQAVVAQSAKPVINWKPIGYAAALAAVLIGMSYLGKMNLLGGKAVASLPDSPPAATSAPASPKTTSTPNPVASSATPSPTPAVVSPTPTPTPAVTPKLAPSSKPVRTMSLSSSKPTAENGGTLTKPTTKPATTATPKAVTMAPKPAAKVVSTPKPKTAPIVHHFRTLRRIVRHAPMRRAKLAHHNRIRVYDANGNAIN